MENELNVDLMNEAELRLYLGQLENKLERIQSICSTTDFVGTSLSNAILEVVEND